MKARVTLLVVLLSACTMPAVQPAADSSWLAPEAANSGPLLYISDFGDFVVDIYSVPALKLVGRLGGFFEPEGECSDAQGHVWIANTGAEQMLEYARGQKKPVATLVDDLGYPGGCAVDASTGDLAVTNLFGNSGAGGVLVYRHGSGTPIPYSNRAQFYYYFAGYDAHGNLYASGLTSKDVYMLSVLPRGAKTMSTVTIHGATLYFPGTVAWSGSLLVLGDQTCRKAKSSCLYEASVSGKSATVTKRIDLTGSCDVAQIVVEKTEMFGGSSGDCGNGSSRVDRWAFPGGGKPLGSIANTHVPLGAAISN